MSEIDEVIKAVRQEFPDVKVSQLTKFGEKPFESGVWKLWLEDKENICVNIEVINGMLLTLYASKDFGNKYPIDATKICEFFRKYKN